MAPIGARFVTLRCFVSALAHGMMYEGMLAPHVSRTAPFNC